MPELTLTLPFPPKNLSPNSRTCWQEKLKAKTAQRNAGYFLAISTHTLNKFPLKLKNPTIPITLLFYPPDKRKRDLDNLLASSKQLLDGVAFGLGVDDRCFRPITIDFGKIDRKNPRVEILLEIH